MNPYDMCDSCGGPGIDGWVIIRDLSMDGAELCVCYHCGRYFLERDSAVEPRFQLVGETSIHSAVVRNYMSTQDTPYDQAMARYKEEHKALEDHQRRLTQNAVANQALGDSVLDHDVVLDEYNARRYELARICGNISPVVSYGNMAETQGNGRDHWRDLRSSPVGG